MHYLWAGIVTWSKFLLLLAKWSSNLMCSCKFWFTFLKLLTRYCCFPRVEYTCNMWILDLICALVKFYFPNKIASGWNVMNILYQLVILSFIMVAGYQAVGKIRFLVGGSFCTASHYSQVTIQRFNINHKCLANSSDLLLDNSYIFN